MQLPIVMDGASAKPLQRQLVDQFQQMISEGILLPGAKVPSSRALSTQLSIARNTVTFAYDQLISEGYLEPGRAATYVSQSLPERFIRADTPATLPHLEAGSANDTESSGEALELYTPAASRLPLDFKIGRPDHSLFPNSLWRRVVSECLGAAERALGDYPDPAGHLPLRVAIAQRLRFARGIRASADEVIIVAGAQEALNLTGRLLGVAGRTVVVEEPCYFGAALVMKSLGAHLAHVKVREDGIDVDALPQANVNSAIVTPSHQFPLGYTMSLERRRSILGWAARTGAYIIEDDYDSDFRYASSPLVALRAIDECERVIYIGTFSKCIGPALRLGYVVVPRHLAADARKLKALMNNGHPWLDQAVVAEFLKGGAFEHHLTRLRKNYQERLQLTINSLQAIFPHATFEGQDGGMHLTCFLPQEALPAPELRRRLLQLGVGVYTVGDGPSYCADAQKDYDRILLLGYPSLDKSEIAEAMRRLQTLVGQDA